MESGSNGAVRLIAVTCALILVLSGCSEDTTKPLSGKARPPDGFVLIPADTFMMGSPPVEPGRRADETLHSVILSTSFYMAETEVTNEQYAEMAQWAFDNSHCIIHATLADSDIVDNMGDTPWELLEMTAGGCEISFRDGQFLVAEEARSNPVRGVTWAGAAAYCDWLSLRERLPRAYEHSLWLCNGNHPYEAEGYRLPTEAEWEYACRAGTRTPFSTGNCLDSEYESNFNGGEAYSDCPGTQYVNRMLPVRCFPANAFGLFDMHGNLREWCNDWYGEYNGDASDPAGPITGGMRVCRGGCWTDGAMRCRSAFREEYVFYDGLPAIGFRPVKSAD